MKNLKYPLQRLRDDDYVDRVEVLADHSSLAIWLRPRYKTSGLSGSEWRVSATLRIEDHLQKVVETTFGNMSWAMQFAPHVVWPLKKLLHRGPATLSVYRKGHLLWSGRFPAFGDAAIPMWWHFVHANESDQSWKHLPDDVEQKHCGQPGCKETPTVLFKMKKRQYGHDHHTMLVPQYDFEGQYRRFCPRHSTRGDSDLEDRDDNYELIEGEIRHVHPMDESESILGAVIELKDRRR